ncbi:hypothetical protein P692DRAFT_20289960 [Suillus brevipes Sb2]|nr:hypothetical protein P692DRAFT_20289960 [Suillus brevipes Sb2]
MKICTLALGEQVLASSKRRNGKKLCAIFLMILRRCSSRNYVFTSHDACPSRSAVTVSGESGALKIGRDDFRPALDAWEVLKEESFVHYHSPRLIKTYIHYWSMNLWCPYLVPTLRRRAQVLTV